VHEAFRRTQDGAKVLVSLRRGARNGTGRAYALPPRPRRNDGIVDRHFLLIVMIVGVVTVAYCGDRMVFMP
jgi:hypothetical protein